MVTGCILRGASPSKEGFRHRLQVLPLFSPSPPPHSFFEGGIAISVPSYHTKSQLEALWSREFTVTFSLNLPLRSSRHQCPIYHLFIRGENITSVIPSISASPESKSEFSLEPKSPSSTRHQSIKLGTWSGFIFSAAEFKSKMGTFLFTDGITSDA